MKRFFTVLFRILGICGLTITAIMVAAAVFMTGQALLGAIIMVLLALMATVIFFWIAATIKKSGAAAGQPVPVQPLPQQRAQTPQQPQLNVRQPSEYSDLSAEARDFLYKLRRADDNIRDEKVSRDVREIANLTRQIFANVDNADAGKRQMINRFANYYLPTTLKLLDIYADLQRRGIETASVERTRMKIEDSLDDVRAAFRNMFENIMQSTLIDVSSEIMTMENLFRSQGLLDDGSNFSRSHYEKKDSGDALDAQPLPGERNEQ